MTSVLVRSLGLWMWFCVQFLVSGGANFKIGRFLSIPLAFVCLFFLIITISEIHSGELADEKTIGWWFVSLLWGWALATPVNIAVRVWLYVRSADAAIYTTCNSG